MSFDPPRDLAQALEASRSHSRAHRHRLPQTITIILSYLRWDPDSYDIHDPMDTNAFVAFQGLVSLLENQCGFPESLQMVVIRLIDCISDIVKWQQVFGNYIFSAGGIILLSAEQIALLIELIGFWRQCTLGPPALKVTVPSQIRIMLDIWSARLEFPWSLPSPAEGMPALIHHAVLAADCRTEVDDWIAQRAPSAADELLDRLERYLFCDIPNYEMLNNEVKVVGNLSDKFPRLGETLSEHGLVVHSARCLFRLSIGAFKDIRRQIGEVETESIVSSLCYFLYQAFRSSDGAIWVEDAIREGILVSSLRTVAWGRAEAVRSFDVLFQSLRTYVAYFCVARALRSSISKIEKNHPLALKKGKDSSVWMCIKSAEQYVSLVKHTPRKCGAPKCPDREWRVDRYRRCGTCQTVYYCSYTCQRDDWGEGGHRERCNEIRKSRQGIPSYCFFIPNLDALPTAGKFTLDEDHLTFLRKLLKHQLRTLKIGDFLHQNSPARLDGRPLRVTFDAPHETQFPPGTSPIPGKGKNFLIVCTCLARGKICRSVTFRVQPRQTAVNSAKQLAQEMSSEEGPLITVVSADDAVHYH